MGYDDSCRDQLQRKRDWNMPQKMIGAEIEPRAVTFSNLFEIRRLADTEIKRRAEEYLKALGYDWYRMEELAVTMTERGSVSLIVIRAKYENFHQSYCTDLEVPLKQFQTLVPSEKEVGDGIRAL